MNYLVPPFGAGPQYPPTTTGQTPPLPYPTYGPFMPPEPPNQLLNIGGGLAALGGFVVGIGWLAPTELYWVILGIGWLMFGPGGGLGLLGLGKQRAR